MFIKHQRTRANTWMYVGQLPNEKLRPSPLACVQSLESLARSGLTLKPFQGEESSKQQLVLHYFKKVLEKSCRGRYIVPTFYCRLISLCASWLSVLIRSSHLLEEAKSKF